MVNKENILNMRERRDDWFLRNFSSSLSKQQIESFAGLDYYPYDPNFFKVCDIELLSAEERATFAVEGYGQIELRKYGSVHAEIGRQKVTLHLYCDKQAENPIEMIAPFKDGTNGQTTYGGGRNLEIQIVDGKAIVDFNGATNMECAYSSESVCAMPLPENWLAVSIEAGEKVFCKK